MMTDLNFLDHNIQFTYEDLHELQLHSDYIPKQKQKFKIFSMDTIAIWTDVDSILDQKQKSSTQPYQIECIEMAKQKNEAEQTLNIDALEVSFKSDESFESPNWTFNLSNGNQASTNGIRKTNK